MVNGRGSCFCRKPHFFKILMGNFENKLRIPQPFIKHFPEGSQSSHRAILEGPSGSCWNVRLNRTTNGMYIQDGWGTFLKDHSLHKHDFLVFRYDGDMHFTVKVFDKSACQRRDAITVKPSKKSTYCEGRKNCDRSQPNGLTTKGLGTTNKSSLDPSHLTQHLREPKTECMSELQNPRLYDQSNSPQGKLPSSSKQVRSMTVGKREVMKASPSFRSDFPYFGAKLKMSNVVKPFNFTIPVKFARKHLPSKEMDVVLRTEGGSWPVHCYVRPSQYAFCGGWHKFTHDNRLKEGDYCIFELIRGRVMNVYFYRC